MKDVTETQSTAAAVASPEPDTLRPVDVGDYELGRELARGGMGVITEAVDRRHGRVVALKRPLGSEDERLRRFLREARLAARLQHPGIVPVYQAGRLPTGEPFIAMKSVEGQSLSEVVRSTSRFAERLALLPRLIAVADALAYAHEHGVVHRDLTPRNILVGKHGETLIIDWGVAKELSHPEETGVAGSSSSSSESDPAAPTQGAVGTPRYMSPEQARGAPADPRADVYSLGAVLYFTLGGRAPEAEAASPAAALPSLEPAVPPDLAAIVARAMAPEAAQRYGSAAELAADLKRFATGELVRAHDYPLRDLVWRWAKRRRAPLLAGTVALVAVAIIGAASVVRIARERDAARAAEQRATVLRESGTTLVGYLINSLYKKLDDIGRLDTLQGLGAEVRRYYDSVPSTAVDDATLGQRSGSLMILGDVEEDKGNTADALSLYRSALTLSQERLRRFPSAESHHRMSQLHMRIGDSLLNQGHPAEAEREFAAGLASDRAAAALAPERADLVRGQALLIMRLGDVKEQVGDPEGALRQYRTLEETAQAGYRRWPDVLKMLWLVGWAQARLGETTVELGRWPEATGYLDRALETRRQVVARDPKTLKFQGDLAETERIAGYLAEAKVESAQALEHFRKSVELYQPVCAAEPKNQELARHLAVAEQGVGQSLSELGRDAEAVPHLERSVARLEPFIADAKSRESHSISRYLLARALANLGRLDEAQKLSRAAADEMGELEKSLSGRWEGAIMRTHQALYAARAGATEAALEPARAAAAAMKAELAKAPTSHERRVAAIAAWRVVGQVERRAHKLDASGAAFGKALALANQDDDGVRCQLALTLEAAGDSARAAPVIADLRARGHLFPGLTRELERVRRERGVKDSR